MSAPGSDSGAICTLTSGFSICSLISIFFHVRQRGIGTAHDFRDAARDEIHAGGGFHLLVQFLNDLVHRPLLIHQHGFQIEGRFLNGRGLHNAPQAEQNQRRGRTWKPEMEKRFDGVSSEKSLKETPGFAVNQMEQNRKGKARFSRTSKFLDIFQIRILPETCQGVRQTNGFFSQSRSALFLNPILKLNLTLTLTLTLPFPLSFKSQQSSIVIFMGWSV